MKPFVFLICQVVIDHSGYGESDILFVGDLIGLHHITEIQGELGVRINDVVSNLIVEIKILNTIQTATDLIDPCVHE